MRCIDEAPRSKSIIQIPILEKKIGLKSLNMYIKKLKESLDQSEYFKKNHLKKKIQHPITIEPLSQK